MDKQNKTPSTTRREPRNIKTFSGAHQNFSVLKEEIATFESKDTKKTTKTRRKKQTNKLSNVNSSKWQKGAQMGKQTTTMKSYETP